MAIGPSLLQRLAVGGWWLLAFHSLGSGWKEKAFCYYWCLNIKDAWTDCRASERHNTQPCDEGERNLIFNKPEISLNWKEGGHDAIH